MFNVYSGLFQKITGKSITSIEGITPDKVYEQIIASNPTPGSGFTDQEMYYLADMCRRVHNESFRVLMPESSIVAIETFLIEKLDEALNEQRAYDAAVLDVTINDSIAANQLSQYNTDMAAYNAFAAQQAALDPPGDPGIAPTAPNVTADVTPQQPDLDISAALSSYIIMRFPFGPGTATQMMAAMTQEAPDNMQIVSRADYENRAATGTGDVTFVTSEMADGYSRSSISEFFDGGKIMLERTTQYADILTAETEFFINGVISTLYEVWSAYSIEYYATNIAFMSYLDSPGGFSGYESQIATAKEVFEYEYSAAEVTAQEHNALATNVNGMPII